jgi:hypothetical protein
MPKNPNGGLFSSSKLAPATDSACACFCSYLQAMDFASQLSKMWRYQYFKGKPNVRRPTPGGRVTVLVSLSAILILVLSRLAGATTINANSAAQSDVATAIASASNGDIVIIPGGTATWTRTMPVRKAITLQGAGVGQTIVKDNVQSGSLLAITLVANNVTRITGIEFQDGGRINGANGGTIHVDGSNTNGSQFRFDHNAWNRVNGTLLCDTVIGVIDHNTFTMFENVSTVRIYGSHWDGANYGDGSWAAPTGFGSSQFLFIEDNVWNGMHPPFVLPMTDAYGGARFVVRHNQIHDCFVTNHGTESTGRTRGARAMEVYNNTFTGTNLNHFVGGSRSGALVFHDNSISGYGGDPVFTLTNHRSFFPFGPWGGADGTNRWDVNAPNAFFTGTAASNSSGTTVTVSGANWTRNQWVGYTVRRTSNLCNSKSITFALIVSNTSNTITYTETGGYGAPFLSFCAGDNLEFLKVDHALDQPGRAGGSLISGDNPNPPTGWNNQVTEPCYAWNNGNTPLAAVHGSIRQNIHYFDNTPMPGYTPYVYPHPLTTGQPLRLPTHSATPSSQLHLNKGKEEKAKKIKRWKWGRAKEKTDS